MSRKPNNYLLEGMRSRSNKKNAYMFSLLVSIDQFGNALAFGNPDLTISARVGYFSEKAQKKYRWYWRALELIINWAFRPIDGKNHCKEAYKADKEEAYIPRNIFSWLLLPIITVPSAIIIGILIHLFVLLFPGYKK